MGAAAKVRAAGGRRPLLPALRCTAGHSAASALNYGSPLLMTSYSRLYTTTTYCLCNRTLSAQAGSGGWPRSLVAPVRGSLIANAKMSRDLALHLSNKLSGDWSAGAACGMLSEAVVAYLVSKWGTLDPLVRARLMLSPLFLRKRDLEELRPALASLAEAGRADRRARGGEAARTCLARRPGRADRRRVGGARRPTLSPAALAPAHLSPPASGPWCVQGRVGACDGARCGWVRRPPAHGGSRTGVQAGGWIGVGGDWGLQAGAAGRGGDSCGGWAASSSTHSAAS
jgi:hypothetical protein